MTNACEQITEAFRGVHASERASNAGAALAADFTEGQPYKAFIPYIVAGDPDIPASMAVIRAAVEGGADLVEIGIPFSDPTAEGPVIQQASERALNAGTTTDKVFQMVRDLRAGREYSGDQAAREAALAEVSSPSCDAAGSAPQVTDHAHAVAEPEQTSSFPPITVPLVFMTYANVVFSYGTERFIRTCAEIGVTGLILPDVPLEERGEFINCCDQYGIGLIPLITPTSADRIASIAQAATGWIYVVSSLGVTGTRSEITTDLGAITQVIRENTDLPCAVGFGISTPQQAASIAPHADGVIVGSAIVKIVAQYGHDAPPYVRDYVSSVVAAIR